MNDILVLKWQLIVAVLLSTLFSKSAISNTPPPLSPCQEVLKPIPFPHNSLASKALLSLKSLLLKKIDLISQNNPNMRLMLYEGQKYFRPKLLSNLPEGKIILYTIWKDLEEQSQAFNGPEAITKALIQERPVLDNALIFAEAWPLWIGPVFDGESQIPEKFNFKIFLSPEVAQGDWRRGLNFEARAAMILGFVSEIHLIPSPSAEAQDFREINNWSHEPVIMPILDFNYLMPILEKELGDLRVQTGNPRLTYKLLRMNAFHSFYLSSDINQVISYALTLSGTRNNSEYIKLSLTLFERLQMALLTTRAR